MCTSTALVTGANRGLGRALAAELLSRGATVYAAARNPDQVELPGAKPIAPDITDPASAAAAVQATGDVTVLINNAGISTGANLLASDQDAIRLEMDTHLAALNTLPTGQGLCRTGASPGRGEANGEPLVPEAIPLDYFRRAVPASELLRWPASPSGLAPSGVSADGGPDLRR
ncbi:SDR family NAD(P)-dependent oxidoreductase [Streptomyces cynarae]|uniref:SDR family NAD(P)-dependent oxidoreductase n=1 Tax=Streptomyces cynarae TaxID=2981134 RepID=A0ABY6ECG8_9ACTN|nr:SDR family NAD(P)-dependent oxidoreductase [Streptomyces cynarae]UXY24354.1 SDR family NAD(P)-dependent oxidoreductase [Streptomyces cynarae]